MSSRLRLQWNLSIQGTFGTQLAVLYREVSLIQRKICTQLYVVGTADSALNREVSFIETFHSIKTPHPDGGLHHNVSIIIQCHVYT